jgi:hypothetical protein
MLPPMEEVTNAKRLSVSSSTSLTTSVRTYGPTGLPLRSVPHSSRGAFSFIFSISGIALPDGMTVLSISFFATNFCTSLSSPRLIKDRSGPITAPSRVTNLSVVNFNSRAPPKAPECCPICSRLKSSKPSL